MKYISKKNLSYIVLGMFLSQQFFQFGFAYNLTVDENTQEDSQGVKNSFSNPLISDEADLQLISDEASLVISDIEKQKLNSKEDTLKSDDIDIRSIVVQYKKGKSEIGSNIAQTSLQQERSEHISTREMTELDIGIITFDTPIEDIDTTLSEITKLPFVEYAEPNHKRYSMALSGVETNDPRSSELWHLQSIQADEAWRIYNDVEDSTLVSVNDTGIDYTHTDLDAQLKDLSSNCKNSSGATINGGCPKHGINLETGSDAILSPEETYDISGHGTAISGIIGAERGNRIGVSGVSENIEIMSVRGDSYSSLYSAFYTSDNIEALDFAISNNSRVVNLSYGGASFSQMEYDSIERAKDSGILVIAAAGNSSVDNDASPLYPASYDLDNIMSVAALGTNDQLTPYSNYGLTTVDIAAPGGDIINLETGEGGILTTYPGQETVFEESFNTHSGYTVSGTGSDWYAYSSGLGIHTQTPLLYTGSVDSTLLFQDNFSLSGASIGMLEGVISCDFGTSGIFDSDFGDSLIFSIHEQDTGLDNFLDLAFSDHIASLSNNRFKIPITDSSLFTDNLQLKIRFTTDDDTDVGQGCYIDDLAVVSHKQNASSYKYVQGTSFAAPVVAGVAAMLWSYDPSLNYTEIRDILLSSTDAIGIEDKIASGGKVNAKKALKELFKRHGISKSGELSEVLTHAQNINLDSGKELVLSGSNLYLGGLGNVMNIRSGGVISGSGEINLPVDSNVILSESRIIRNPLNRYIDFSDSIGTNTTLNPDKTLYGKGIFLKYQGDNMGNNLKIRVGDFYDGPFNENIFIPIESHYSGFLDYQVYITGSGYSQISDDVTINIYSGATSITFENSERFFKITPEIGQNEAGQDVEFSLEAIDFDGNRKEDYVGSVTLETNIPNQTEFSGELFDNTFTFQARDAGIKNFSGALMYGIDGNHELTAYDVLVPSFSGSSIIGIGKRTIPVGTLTLSSGSATKSETVRVHVSSSEYPVSYTLGGDLMQTYTGSLNSSNTIDIELSPNDGQKEITLSLEDFDQNMGQSSTSISLDQTPPMVNITSHTDGQELESPSIQLSGTIIDQGDIASLSINNSPVSVSSNSWTIGIILSSGENLITYTTRDQLGNTRNGEIKIIYTPQAQNFQTNSSSSSGGGGYSKRSESTKTGIIREFPESTLQVLAGKTVKQDGNKIHAQEEGVLKIQTEPKRERQELKSTRPVRTGRVNGAEFTYTEYENPKISQFQLELFRFIHNSNGSLKDYEAASELVRLIVKYLDFSQESREKADIKQEIIQVYRNLTEPKF